MTWVAVDRAVRTAERFRLDAPLDRWRRLRDEIHDEVCRRGFDEKVGAFTQSYGSPNLDASLLLLPLVGFLPVDDPRVSATVAAIERDLGDGGLLHRYSSDGDDADGLPAGEGRFLVCSFWLVEVMALQGRHREARALFERLVGLANDVGLLSEEYDTHAGRLVGNFPQAFSHMGLVHAALALSGRTPPGVASSR